ncbi:hypothetical protein B0H13DRAFT_2356451 [Mycena leptocephala]|nr:hypothetical protein B0H13DRAFT_2356451 [Mycena leptocephala]
MPDITLVPANLTTLVLESFLYGLLLILFISTVYFIATRRTLASTNQTARHHFTSLVFLGVTALFLIVTVHWSIVIYQTFFAFIHLGSAAAEDAFYADLAKPVEVAKATILFVAILLGDALVWFLSILVESAALQTLWLILTAVTLLVNTDVDFILADNFPAILGISNTLIHARVGLGWSPNSPITGEVCRSCCLKHEVNC